MSDRELRELLRRGDPAGDGSEPDREERTRMRAAVLDAAMAESSTRPLAGLLLPAGALITVLLVVGVSWVVLDHRPAIDPALDAGTAAPPAVAVAEAEAVPVEPAPDFEPEAAVPAVKSPGPAGEIASTEDDTPRDPRTIRFTAAGGTRIIWTLDPEFEI